MENDVTSIVLNDEDGNEVEFEVITKMDIEDKEYLVVVPKDRDEEDTDEAIVLRIDKDEDDNDILVTVEDDDEFEIVSEAYETLFSEDELN
ncbi:DUF1292 domain-containing protein [Clostridium thailandense]|uniref:UPF0473 protein I6U48_03075 n=1 Tax=Clostridium thailandense TaxID=2794346 RepID=A0A949WPV7_9CLOT|nr:DUF1292 domain-containing protein [Clostridium thailandense]MBV7271896.1 DUF1292 domain-containing protein [Clostridium thailandense]MCH5137122.1 DUF1292 domain-containing protein [Clostridiaceae bacterium UIB06]